MKVIEYYRLWADGTWDTANIKIPDNTPKNEFETELQKAVGKIDNWKNSPPVIVGVYQRKT